MPRRFFKNELSWRQEKVDELLLPIIRRMNQRSQANAMNKQSLLDPFLEKGSNGIAPVPRKRQGYASKRLREVVSDFRKQKKAQEQAAQDAEQEENAESSSKPPKEKRTVTRRRGPRKPPPENANSKGKKRASAKGKSSDEEEEDAVEGANAIPSAPLAVKLRPRTKPKRRKVEIESGEEQSE